MKILQPLLLVALTALLLVGCNYDEEYTTSSNDRLSFSEDTVRFDTVFTAVGSSTKRFKAFNKASKALRIASVSLASGGTSGFRVNVDGHWGSQLSDIEVLAEDSIFIFAEVTVDPHDSDSPLLLRDSLQFVLESGVTQQVILEAYGQDVIVLRAETISSDETLSSARPYLIYDSLVVAENATLTLPAGTTLCFHSGAYLGVHGAVVANGTTDSPVVFRGDRTDRMFSNLTYDQLDAQWGGIILYPESYGNSFTCADIHSGNYGIKAPLSGCSASKLSMLNSTISNVSGNALEMVYAAADFQNCEISNAGNNCVDLLGGSYQFIHCTIAQFYPWDSSYAFALSFANVKGDTIYPLHQALFANSVITGRSADQIYGSQADDASADFNAQFVDCLINIALTGKESEQIQQMFAQSFNEEPLFSSDSDDAMCGGKNFRTIGEDYIYDFHLDSLSNARQRGSNNYLSALPQDKDGKDRPSSPDAGCYQF